MITRCPNCQIPMTSEELEAKNCPVCGAALNGNPSTFAISSSHQTPGSGGGSLLLRLSAAAMLVISGGVAGFAARPIWSESIEEPIHEVSENPVVPRASGQDQTRDDGKKEIAADPAIKTKQRLEELEETAAKLSRERDQMKKVADAARLKAEEAIRIAEKTLTDELAMQTKQMKELEDRAGKLSKELDLHKELLAEAKELAGKPAPADPKIKTLEALTAKLIGDLRVAKDQANQAKSREEAGRRTIEQVRRESNQALNHLNQATQRTLDQVRQQHTQAIEQVRRELNQQRIETQKAKTDASKYKRAADEAKSDASKYKRAAEELRLKKK